MSLSVYEASVPVFTRGLTNLRAFGRSDWAAGWAARGERVAGMTALFESAVLREFEQGYEFWDVDGRMRKYAHVLDTLNGGQAGVDLFIQKHPLFSDREVLANSMDCVNQAPADAVTLEPSRRFFDTLARKVNEQAAVMERDGQSTVVERAAKNNGLCSGSKPLA